jgi:GTP-binding protein
MSPTAPLPKPGAAAHNPAAAALAWLHGARFLTTASRLDQLPSPGLPEIAFVGRSNAGKSTAINTLAQHKRLAFASRTPGRTQHINLFELGPAGAPDALLADLPGYGFAAVAREDKRRWQQVMADYLAEREALAAIVQMVDVRLGFTELDERLLDFITPRLAGGGVKLLVLLTKCDKVSRKERNRASDEAQALLAPLVAAQQADIGVALFSALSREGVDDVALTLHGWRQGA